MFTEELFVPAGPRLSEELLVSALMVVVVSPSVSVWSTVPLAGRGTAWPFTVKLVWLEEVPVSSVGEGFKESPETEDSDGTEEEGRGAAKLCMVWPVSAAADWWYWRTKSRAAAANKTKRAAPINDLWVYTGAANTLTIVPPYPLA
jgi:hypothetical protein